MNRFTDLFREYSENKVHILLVLFNFKHKKTSTWSILNHRINCISFIYGLVKSERENTNQQPFSHNPAFLAVRPRLLKNFILCLFYNMWLYCSTFSGHFYLSTFPFSRCCFPAFKRILCFWERHCLQVSCVRNVLRIYAQLFQRLINVYEISTHWLKSRKGITGYPNKVHRRKNVLWRTVYCVVSGKMPFCWCYLFLNIRTSTSIPFLKNRNIMCSESCEVRINSDGRNVLSFYCWIKDIIPLVTVLQCIFVRNFFLTQSLHCTHSTFNQRIIV